MKKTKRRISYSIKIGYDIHNVIGKKTNGEGYVLLKMPTHPYAMSNGYVLEHRAIFESVTGVYLSGDVIIHHLNGIKNDNRFGNLQMMDRGEHTIHHHKGAKRSKETRRKNSIASIKLGFVGTKHPMYKNVDKQIEELYKKRVPVARIASMTGVTRKTVYNKLDYLGLRRDLNDK